MECSAYHAQSAVSGENVKWTGTEWPSAGVLPEPHSLTGCVIGFAFLFWLLVTGGRTQCELNCIGGVCVQTPDGRWECRCAPPLVLINGQCLPCPIPCVGGRCEPDFNGGAVCVCPFDTSLVNGVCIPNRQLCEERCINGQCVLWNNIWQCRCPDGWELIIDRCVDVKGQCDRECVNGFCVRNTNTGQWECRCYPGFEFVLGRGCVQIDYCGTGPPKCENGLCFNIIGGYRCQCSPGFEPTPDGRACVPTQETICKQNCQGGTCLWDITLGQYICNCPPGFRLLNGMCTDIDECLNPTLCQNGRCVNLPGSFRCECNPGFRPTPDSMGCVEIVSPPTCQCTGGFCLLVNGIFRCVCPYGFELQGPSTCVDVNECVANPCRGGDCDNFPGGHVCLNCLPNYQLAPDGKSCIGFNPRPPPLPQPIGFPWWLLFLKDF
ncbi:hypothetical protein BaRGS_00029819 [Batillaria attramentaria]|uniref:EGF-like domain-containing protein n=1 Tax=Batillaria attramentaria TaxID=370345 RepID=A0ABD0JWD0_9CAEN